MGFTDFEVWRYITMGSLCRLKGLYESGLKRHSPEAHAHAYAHAHAHAYTFAYTQVGMLFFFGALLGTIGIWLYDKIFWNYKWPLL